MTEKNKWKSRLLSSSVPMEHEIARILVDAGFSVQADYSYARVDATDAAAVKDFSVDILARAFSPFDEDRILASVSLLVECKHRNRGNKWLFFPDPNHADYSSFTLGQTIRGVDEFCQVVLPLNGTTTFDEDIPYCYKGVEVDLFNGIVTDSEIKHGLSQLQYAQPQFLTYEIRFNVLGHDESNTPIYFCPILVTTSEIYLARSDLSISSIEGAESLDDFATAVPYIIIGADWTPDFDRHRTRECAPLQELLPYFIESKIDAYRESIGEYKHRLPTNFCTTLIEPDGRSIQGLFSQTLVCSMHEFGALISKIKCAVLASTIGITTHR
jgi:hypothetical protein